MATKTEEETGTWGWIVMIALVAFFIGVALLASRQPTQPTYTMTVVPQQAK